MKVYFIIINLAISLCDRVHTELEREGGQTPPMIVGFLIFLYCKTYIFLSNRMLKML